MYDSYDRDNMPLGFESALAQNVSAMERFAQLDIREQRSIIEQAQYIESKSEMKAFVKSIGQVI